MAKKSKRYSKISVTKELDAFVKTDNFVTKNIIKTLSPNEYSQIRRDSMIELGYNMDDLQKEFERKMKPKIYDNIIPPENFIIKPKIYLCKHCRLPKKPDKAICDCGSIEWITETIDPPNPNDWKNVVCGGKK